MKTSGLISLATAAFTSSAIAGEAATWAELRDLIGTVPPPKLVTVTADIPVTESGKIVKAETRLEFSPGRKLIGSPGMSLTINGIIPDRPEQFFENWTPGQISGAMAGMPRRPEWWGGMPNDERDDDHAINCAIRVKFDNTGYGQAGARIVLGAGVYRISEPIDLRNSRSIIEGQSSWGTFIKATTTGNKWHSHRVADENFPAGHVAMIWIGSGGTSAAPEPPGLTWTSFGTSVRNVCLGGHAEIPNLSLISAKAGAQTFVEEMSILDGINGEGFSAYGVGFSDTTVVNGLKLSNFSIVTPSFGRLPGNDSLPLPLYIPPNSVNFTVESGTLGGWSQGNDGWLMTGVTARGMHTKLSSLHIESVKYGILIPHSNAGSSISIDCVDVKCPGINADPGSSVVRIEASATQPQNLQSSVTAQNIRARDGSSRYLLQDPAFSVNLNVEEARQHSATPTEAHMAFYARGVGRRPDGRLWKEPADAAGLLPAPQSPRLYFFGPVY